MGTYDDLAVGETFASAARELTEEDVDLLVRVGGYTHPLFTDPAFAAASTFGRRPLPGEAILHVMGGLVEQTGRFDDTVIALVGFDDVRFRGAAFAGDSINVEVEIVAKEGKPDDRGLITMAWRCLGADGRPLVEATARMLFQRGAGP
ncbi:MAG TPA: MaoC/PaaZ C-terminal domain-containing protein [Actinomycetota bacterium]